MNDMFCKNISDYNPVDEFICSKMRTYHERFAKIRN